MGFCGLNRAGVMTTVSLTGKPEAAQGECHSLGGDPDSCLESRPCSLDQ